MAKCNMCIPLVTLILFDFYPSTYLQDEVEIVDYVYKSPNPGSLVASSIKLEKNDALPHTCPFCQTVNFYFI